MDLLETVLRTANALEYLEQFRKEDITAKTLKLLVDEDLQIIGVDDIEVRNRILKQAANLQIQSEKLVDRKFDTLYVNNAMHQITQQLGLYNAMLTPMAVRPDVVNVTIPIALACESLSNAMEDLHQEIINLKIHVLKSKGLSEKGDKKHQYLVPGIIVLVCCIVPNVLALKRVISYFS